MATAYNEQYSQDLTAWRELGAKYKAANILAVCKGRQFSRVLECGAGEGSVLQHLDTSGEFAELTAIEISDSGLARIKKRRLRRLVEARKFDGYRIPFADNAFDMAYCSHVIEHVEHPRLLLRELKRVSRFQVFEVPLDYSTDVDTKVEHLMGYGHINVYTPSLFRFLLKSEGFQIKAELLTRIANEVLRFNRYANQRRPRSLIWELRLALRPIGARAKSILQGSRHFNEFGFSAYTCLAQGEGDLAIFRSPARPSAAY